MKSKNKIKSILTMAFMPVALVSVINLSAQQNVVSLNLSDAKTTINKHIYGHFAEHLGHCIYGGFYVGDTSKIPNKDGVRTDIIEALKN